MNLFAEATFGLQDAFAAIFSSPQALLLVATGTALGIVVGAIPGLTGAMLITLTLPLTFGMQQPADAMVLLISMYVGSISGGLITATVLRMPGTPASIMTTLDGYPLAQRDPGRALGLGMTASFVGGLISWIFLWLLAGVMADLSTKLTPFNLFALVLMALALMATVSGDSLTRGLLSGLLGILTALPGQSPATGELRLTFGIGELNDGLKLLPVLIGLFAVSQVIHELLRGDSVDEVLQDATAASVSQSPRGLFMSFADWRQQSANMLRSSLIGTWVGILPGIGANIGSVLAYSAARWSSKTPEKFGTGAESGIVASEAANNATVGGALIPLIAIGIPGSVIDAILLGALVIHGLQPGPLLFRDSPDVVQTIIATMLLANVFMFIFMMLSVRWLIRLVNIPREFLLPAILVFCVVGSFGLGNRMFDVWVMLAFGLFGFGLEMLKVPLAPFVIGFVLAPIAEEKLGAGLMLSNGSYRPLMTEPISALLTLLAAVILCVPLWSRLRQRMASRQDV